MSSAALMSPPHTVRVGDAVTLHILQTERFKTARLSSSASCGAGAAGFPVNCTSTGDWMSCMARR